jgi:hypothetical protein
LKINKLPGTDLIQAELNKHAGAEYIKHLNQFITKFWITETILEGWNMNVLCPIHKKGDITICSSNRGIKQTNKLRGLSLQVNYTDRATAACGEVSANFCG